MKYSLLVSAIVFTGLQASASVKPIRKTTIYASDSTTKPSLFSRYFFRDSSRIKLYPMTQVTPIKQLYKMPIARMDVHSKMPVIKADSSVTYKMPVMKLDPTPKSPNNSIYP